MDNPLTPNKIQRLIHLAEDKSFNISRRLLINDEDLKRYTENQGVSVSSTNKSSNMNCAESSSGLLDLDRVDAFGESTLGNESLSKSTAFNPGEMTGRSTGADEITKPLPLGRHSLALETITSNMDKQTIEINDIMRHSIATNYSFHSKRDLTADEASLVVREGILPVQNNTQTYFQESMMTADHSNISVGAYFKNRCPDFGRILSKTDSPDRSGAMPSITEVSIPFDAAASDISKLYKLDETLDCVPVRQARSTNPEKVPEKLNNFKPTTSKMYEKQSFHSVAKSEFVEPKVPEAKAVERHIYPSTSNVEQNYFPLHINPIGSSTLTSQKSFKNSVLTPTDILIKNMQNSMKLVTEDTEGSTDNSLSISKIADYLGKQSNVSVSDMLQLNNQKKALNRKQPLTELHLNMQTNLKKTQEEVTKLADTRKAETASSAGTVNTVILNKNVNEVPTVVVSRHSLDKTDNTDGKPRSARSKSPSSKSQSTMSTVHENFTSFKSSSSPQNSKGDANASHVPSPNIEYKELDKSVVWHELLQQKQLKQEGLAKEQWAEIVTTTANGFVGVSCAVTVRITTLTDSWLTAKFQFDQLPNEGLGLTIELPRLPLLLSPGKSEQITLHITSTTELNTSLPFTMCLKDASIDGDIEQKGSIDVHIKMPIIQAMSADGINKVVFPAIAENSSLIKSFVLLSDCAADLQLELSVSEGDAFAIKNVQEIKRSDVNKVLMDRQGSVDDGQAKGKLKGLNKQLCRLTSGTAIRITVKFNAPKLNEQDSSTMNVTGYLNVNLIGVNTILRKVDLVGTVGTVNLVVEAPDNKIQLTNEPYTLTVANTGSVGGAWLSKILAASPEVPFKLTPNQFDLQPGDMTSLNLTYIGPADELTEGRLLFEEITTGNKTVIEIFGGTDRPKTFPIKTNHNSISWVRAGRKELSLKNSSNRKVHVRCQLIGEGFSIDLPGMESRGVYSLPFAPNECRPLPIVFAPNSIFPHSAALHLAPDRNSEFSRTVKLHGCVSEAARWAGLVTYGDTALVRAAGRAPVLLDLYNKSAAPVFLSAQVHFNLQYQCVAASARLVGARRVLRPRARHTLRLSLDWARVERRARDAASSALATLTVLTGGEYTRRRILRVVRDESSGQAGAGLPAGLRPLAERYEGEDAAMDDQLADFMETKASLDELIGGLQELTAQIVLPQDFADENTIVITDDTVVEHHTLCD